MISLCDNIKYATSKTKTLLTFSYFKYFYACTWCKLVTWYNIVSDTYREGGSYNHS